MIENKIKPTLLKRRDVEQLVCLSCPSIYRLMDEGSFPRPVKLGARAVAWKTVDIEAWLQSREKSEGWK